MSDIEWLHFLWSLRKLHVVLYRILESVHGADVVYILVHSGVAHGFGIYGLHGTIRFQFWRWVDLMVLAFVSAMNSSNWYVWRWNFATFGYFARVPSLWNFCDYLNLSEMFQLSARAPSFSIKNQKRRMTAPLQVLLEFHVKLNEDRSISIELGSERWEMLIFIRNGRMFAHHVTLPELWLL